MATNPEFFTHEDVTIYHELRDNHEQSVIMNFWYSTSPAVQHEEFDVRDLPYSASEDYSTRREKHKAVIKSAIDDGFFSGAES